MMTPPDRIGPKPAKLARHLPLLLAAALIVLGLVGQVGGVLLGIAGLAVLLQLVVYLDTGTKRLGRRAVAALVFSLLTLAYLVPRGVRALNNRDFEIELVAAAEEMYWPGGSDELMLSVSPDEEWLIYAVESNLPMDWAPRVMLRNLPENRERFVDFSAFRPRSGGPNPVAAEVARRIGSACWTPSRVRMGNVSVELATGHATRCGPLRVECETRQIGANHRPQFYSQLKRMAPGLYEQIDMATDWSDSLPHPYTYFARNIKTRGFWSFEGRLERRRADGSLEVLHEKRALTTPWTIHHPSVSPDGRFIAYEAMCKPLWLECVTAPLWFVFGLSANRSYLFVFDLHTGKEHAIRSSSPGSFFWSVDSRRLYFANRGHATGDDVSVVRIDIPPDPRHGLKTVRRVSPSPTNPQRVATIDPPLSVIRVPAETSESSRIPNR
jgi:hypothetical protein